MLRYLNKVLAFVLALTMMVGVTACGEQQESKQETEKEKPLVVGYPEFSGNFSPYTASLQYDTDVVELTQLYLMTTDRAGGIIKNGIEGEETEYNGTDYTYYGPADIDWAYDEETGITTYTAKLREDLKFSDGEPVTADDIIFTYYVYLDPSYEGSVSLNSFNIVGLANYRMNSTAAEGIKVKSSDVKALLKNPSKSLKKKIREYLLNVLNGEIDWCETQYQKKGFESAIAMFLDSYSLDKQYSTTDREAAVKEVAEQYGTDYRTLAMHYMKDKSYFDGDMEQLAYDELYKAAVDEAGGEEVPNIEGIQKIDDYTVQIQVSGYEAPAVYSILGIPITPLHYYGDPSKYDYENNQFGFTRADLSEVNAKEEQPLGAGPYVLKKYQNGTIYFEANPNYYLGEPKMKEIHFREIKEQDLVQAIKKGTVDCGDMVGSVARFNEVSEGNSNKEMTGDVITTATTDALAYGYIGINASKVCVESKPSSEKSKALRKAFMTIFSVYRETTIDEYYGDAACVINYPLPESSWAAPQVTDKDYSVAFSTDKDGNNIYSGNMTADDKYQAALQATIGFLKKAGYVYDEEEGRFTVAPEGAKLSYTIYISANGKGDHPSYGILRNASKALDLIGIELNIKDLEEESELWSDLEEGEVSMWCAAWQSDIDPDMYQIYHSRNVVGQSGGSGSNYYNLKDDDLDSLILSARKSEDQDYRKALYAKCMEIISDWAVELPVYQRQNCTIFSTQRVKTDTIAADITMYYNWMREIHTMEMN